MLTVDEKVLLWVLPLAGLGKGGTSNKGGEGGGGIEKLYNILKKGNFICRKGGTVTSQHAKLIVYLATPFFGQNSNVFKANLAKKYTKK